MVIVELLHLANDLLEALAHEVRPRRCAIVALHVLQEAEEQSVDGHGVDAEERRGDEVRAHADDDDRSEQEVQGWHFVLELRDPPREDKVGQGPDAGNDHELAEKQQEVDDIVQDDHADDVPHEQAEGVLGRDAEVGALDGAHNVRVAVDEPHELLQAPEAALAKAEQTSGEVVVVGLQLALHVLEDGADEPDDRDDQRAEGYRAQVEGQGVAERRPQGAHWHLGLVVRPVPLGEGSCKNELTKGRDKLQGPKEGKQVEPHHPVAHEAAGLLVLGKHARHLDAVARAVEGGRAADVLQDVGAVGVGVDAVPARGRGIG